MTITHIGIVGCGAMGRGIAQIAAQAGYQVVLSEQNPEQLQAALTSLEKTWSTLVDKGRMSPEQFQQARARLHCAQSLQDLAPCQLVIEAIIERLDVKQSLLLDLEKIVAPDCILASNTSSLSVTAIARPCAAPERVAGFHFFNPVPLMKVVEVIGGIRTAPATLTALDEVATRCGHRAVRATDTPGFIVNHAGRGYGTEALKLLAEGVASIPEVDAILREHVAIQGRGFKLGPFELFDLTGLDVSQPVMESIYQQFYHDPRYRPSALAAQRLAGGLLGRKTGLGFYRYENGEQIAPEATSTPTATPMTACPYAIWIDPSSPGAAALATFGQKAGWQLDANPTPSADSLILIAPLGTDASTWAAQQQFDATRVVAVDTLFPMVEARRHVIMPTLITLPDYLGAARAALAVHGTAVSVLRDSAGFVSQRVLAMVVAIACDMAQNRIATPQDIDLAVQIGLNYPAGPLAMGDALGAKTVNTLLDNLFVATNDPRYRPSLWLKRRALLGLSLRHQD